MSVFEVIELSQQQLPARTATRAPLGTGVKLQFDDVVDVVNGVCENISIGGMQVLAEEPRPRGTLVRFELDIDVEQELVVRGLGEVVWMRARIPGAGNGPGMGIKFRFIEQRDRQVIFKLVSKHIKERLAQKHPGMEEPGGLPAQPPEPVSEPVVLEDTPTLVSAGPLDNIEQLMASQDGLSQDGTAAPPMDLDQSFLTLHGQAQTPLAPPPEASSPTPADTVRLDTRDRRPITVEETVLQETVRQETVRQETVPQETVRQETVRQETVPQETVRPERPLDDHGPVVGDLSTPQDKPGNSGYEADELYHPRATRRRELPLVPIALLLLVGGGALLYFYWERIFGPPAPPISATPPISTPTTESAPAESTPVESVPRPVPSTSKPPATSTASRPAPPPPPQVVNSRPFTRVLDITPTRIPGGVKVVIETNGAILDGSYSHFRLEGVSPREVVKLKGIVQQYPMAPMAVSGSPVNQIRVGYHPGPKELHVVIDMRDTATRISQVRIRGKNLEVQLE